MAISRNIPWTRISVEGAAIVLSILLAFSIEAWWDDRQDREDERVVLASLLEDFRAKKKLVVNQRTYNEALLSSTKALLYATTEADHGLSSASIDLLLVDISFNNNAALWSAPLLQSLVSSGDLSLNSNVHLRNSLVAWSGRFARLREVMARDVYFFDNRLMVFMESNVSMPQLLNIIGPIPGLPEYSYDYGGDFSIVERVDHSKLLSNQQFQGLLARRSILLNDILTQTFFGLEADLDATIAALEEELVKKRI